jgi:hypothetical protein
MSRPAEDLREDLTNTMTDAQVPFVAARAKITRHINGLAMIQRSERVALYTALLAMLCVVLLAVLDKLTSVWLLAFFAIPMAWGFAQAARGAVLLSSDVLKHMDAAQLSELGWFTRWVVGAVKAWKKTPEGQP